MKGWLELGMLDFRTPFYARVALGDGGVEPTQSEVSPMLPTSRSRNTPGLASFARPSIRPPFVGARDTPSSSP
jgi:hypothetical protein